MSEPSGVRGGVLLTLIGAVMVAFGGHGLCEFVGYPGETTGAAEVVTTLGVLAGVVGLFLMANGVVGLVRRGRRRA